METQELETAKEQLDSHIDDTLKDELSSVDLAEHLKTIKKHDETQFAKYLKELDPESLANAALEMPDHMLEDVIEIVPKDKITQGISELESDDQAELLDNISDIDENKAKEFFEELDEKDRADILKIAKYDEDEAGAYMQTEIFSAKGSETLKSAIDRLKILKEKEESIVLGDFEEASNLGQEQIRVEEELKKEQKKMDRKRSGKKLTVGEEDVADVVAVWTKIPVSRLTEKESGRLLKLESTLHKRVVGQDEAVTAVAKAIKRGRVGLKDPKRPIGSFLFLGPTGVGKTELSKALAETVFGSEDAMIRVDMSEYMEKHSVSKLVGSPPGYVGYEEGGQLSEKVRRNPYSVILFDEIEKAHPDVFNILLQVLDDGHITDSQGRQVDFKNTILIMTSNAGAQSIISPKKLGFASVDDEKHNYEYMKGSVMEEVRRMFKPEFLNRIDETIVFHALNRENITRIAEILLEQFAKRCKEQIDITLKISSAAKELIAKAGFDEKYGARPLKRAIQTKVEDALAQEILEGKVKAGDKVLLGVSKEEIKFSVKSEKALDK